MYKYREIGKRLKEERGKKSLTILQAAIQADINEKTLRNYENGKITKHQTLLKIAAIYEIDVRELGFIPAGKSSYSLNEARAQLARGKDQLEKSLFSNARVTSDLLIANLQQNINLLPSRDQREATRLLAHAHFISGHTDTITKADFDVALARNHFEAMHKLALSINDQTSLCNALTYDGEMLRREGKFAEAEQALLAAPDHKGVEINARGNRAQMLARLYADIHKPALFKEQIERAKDFAQQAATRQFLSSLSIPFNVFSVEEEEVRSYLINSQINKCLTLIQNAEKHMPDSPRWKTLLKITKGETYLYASIYSRRQRSHHIDIKSDLNCQMGITLLNEGEALARSYNHQRLLRRIINIEQKFSHLGVDCNFIAREIGLIREKSIPGYRDGRI